MLRLKITCKILQKCTRKSLNESMTIFGAENVVTPSRLSTKSQRCRALLGDIVHKWARPFPSSKITLLRILFENITQKKPRRSDKMLVFVPRSNILHPSL